MLMIITVCISVHGFRAYLDLLDESSSTSSDDAVLQAAITASLQDVPPQAK